MNPALDPDYTPEEIIVPQETLDVSAADGEAITKLVAASPIKFQLKRNLSAIDDSTKKQLRWKYQRFEECMKKKFAEYVAPGQSVEFIEDILNNEDCVTEKPLNVPPDIANYVKCYHQSDAMSKFIILAFQITKNTK